MSENRKRRNPLLSSLRATIGSTAIPFSRHCEERSDAAIQAFYLYKKVVQLDHRAGSADAPPARDDDIFSLSAQQCCHVL